MTKVIVFDLGGTLMEYEGMPHYWILYYQECFNSVNNEYDLHLTEDDIELSVEILKEYNPRYKPREKNIHRNFCFKKLLNIGMFKYQLNK